MLMWMPSHPIVQSAVRAARNFPRYLLATWYFARESHEQASPLFVEHLRLQVCWLVDKPAVWGHARWQSAGSNGKVEFSEELGWISDICVDRSQHFSRALVDVGAGGEDYLV